MIGTYSSTQNTSKISEFYGEIIKVIKNLLQVKQGSSQLVARIKLDLDFSLALLNSYTLKRVFLCKYKSKFFRASFLCFPPQQISPLSVGMTKYVITTNGLLYKLCSNWIIFPKELDMVITNDILKFQVILCIIKACQTI